MLRATAGFSTLAQQSSIAFGAGTLTLESPLDLQVLAEIFGHQFQSVSGSQDVEAELPEEAVQEAFRSDAELAFDRFVQQYATFFQLLDDGQDPLWTAISAYYAAFYAANALMLGCGTGLRRFHRENGCPVGGLRRVEIVGIGLSVKTLKLRVSDVLSKGSHQQTWKRLIRLAESASETAGNSPVAESTYAAFSNLVAAPALLSDKRNEVNYDITVSPFKAKVWGSAISALTSSAELESSLLSASITDLGPRAELVAAGCASLYTQLIDEHLSRGGRRDKRRKKWYKSLAQGQPCLEWMICP